MNFPNPYWSEALKIGGLQRWILVHSIIYYELDSSIVSDQVFDRNARQLVQMQKSNPEEAKRSEYWYAFYDFDGSTGFDLYDRLNASDKQKILNTAKYVLVLCGNKKGGGSKVGASRNSSHRK